MRACAQVCLCLLFGTYQQIDEVNMRSARVAFLSVFCSVLQCVAVCCSVLQCVAACCSVLQRVERAQLLCQRV